MIDLISDRTNKSTELDELRTVLLRPDRDQLEKQRQEIDALRDRILQLEALIADTSDRAQAVEEILVDAVNGSTHSPGDLGLALQPEVEHALHASARDDGTKLADAIYPVIGPAIRKMVADLFTLDKNKTGRSFVVEQTLLIERSTGLMLSSTAADQGALDDADIVSGMIDALQTFVEDAFEASESDGLSDLRVGDLSVLVESGPRAVLASVVRGIPTQEYRDAASSTLEDFHRRYGTELENFDGTIDAFEGSADILAELHATSRPVSRGSVQRWSLLAVLLIATVVVAALVIRAVII